MTFSRSKVVATLKAHAPPRFRPRFDDDQWRALENDGWDDGAFVVVADVRESTSLMKEAIDPTGYARALHEFATGARADARSTGGWFDKFTGDGFIVYWPKLGTNADGPRAEAALMFCKRTQQRFPAIMTRFRQHVQNLSAGAGLSLGLDSGDCRLTMVGDDLTVLGAPVVGAVRMVSAAKAGELLVNVHLGEALTRGFVDRPKLRVKRTLVQTKDFPNGQEAYLVEFAT
jgi:class 3 adenylate cyclase